MSEQAKDTAEGKKKGSGLVIKAVLGLVLVGAGGGGVFALQQSGVIGGRAVEHEDNEPKLIRKGQKDPYAPAPAKGEEEAGAEIEGDGGSKYRTAYYSFSDDFTSNLQGSAGLVQISLAAATHHDGRVLLWLKKHELAARSAILVVLADTPEEEVLTQEGKERLRKRLTNAINTVLTDAEGFGGIKDVYFRSFLVQ